MLGNLQTRWPATCAILLVLACGRTREAKEAETSSTASSGMIGSSSGGVTSTPNAVTTSAVITSAEGNAGSGGTTSTTSLAGGGGQTETPSIEGEWAMFGFEDPVQVTLNESDGALAGYGCCAGLRAGSDFCCGDISGDIMGNRVRFAFRVLAELYEANVFLSDDGQRMAGPFKGLGDSKQPTAWVRLAPNQVWLPIETDHLSMVPLSEFTRWRLTLVAGTPGPFDFDQEYQLLVHFDSWGVVSGDLGAFLGSEVAWNESEQTLIAGPVVATSPQLPTSLRIELSDSELEMVQATLASGETYRFEAVRQ